MARLARQQLLQSWVDAVDPDHARGVLSDPDSRAAIEQACEQLALVSAACEETSQELYLLHGSGETRPPAGGAARSSVTLALSRTLRLGELLVLEPGALVEEVATDAGELGAVDAPTGRRYALLDRATFFPGDVGPLEVQALAERHGRGYDHPLPGSIRGLWQPGGGLFNDGATVTPGSPASHRLTAAPRPDAPIPDHVGRTVALTQGANQGQRRRVVGYVRPSPPADAGGLLLARDALLRISGTAGAFEIGEVVRTPGGGKGTLLAVSDRYALVEMLSAVAVTTGALAGDLSGATATIDAVEIPEAMAADIEAAAWQVEDPVAVFGLAIANALSPSGGRDATLDSLAWERGALRAPGESDEALRDRAAEVSDAVVPLAVLRAANRALVAFAAEAQLLEAGRPEMPGIYLDVDALDLDGVALGTPAATGFMSGETVHQETTGASGVAITRSAPGLGVLGAPGLVGLVRVRGTFASGDPIFGERSGASVLAPVFSGGLRPVDRFRVLFSYAEMRAFFLVASSHQGVGDFGFALDSHPFGFLDSTPALSFLDGFPATSAAASQRVWQQVDEVRPAASGFTLVAPSGSST